MKTALITLFTISTLSGSIRAEEDPVPDKFKEAFASYKTREYSGSIEKLREIIAILEERTEKVMGEKILPAVIGDWKAPPAEKGDTSFLGGGSSVTRVYEKSGENITAKIIKDSPLVGQFVKLLSNDELLALSGLKTQKISGEMAVLEGGKDGKKASLRMAVDKRIFVEITGTEKVRQSDLVDIAKKMDLKLLASLK